MFADTTIKTDAVFWSTSNYCNVNSKKKIFHVPTPGNSRMLGGRRLIWLSRAKAEKVSIRTVEAKSGGYRKNTELLLATGGKKIVWPEPNRS